MRNNAVLKSLIDVYVDHAFQRKVQADMNKLSLNSPYQAGSASLSETQQADDDVIDLGALLSTTWRGKWFIALVTVIAVVAGGYYAYVLAVPLYRASAVVMLQTQEQQIVDLQSVMSGMTGDPSEVNSEVEVLRSRGLLGKVVDRLDLTMDPEFNGNLQPPTPVDEAKDKVKALLGLSEEEVVLPPDEAARRERDAVILNLLEAVLVRNIPLSLVFQITVEAESPEKSALIVDTIAELYVLNQLEVKFEATDQATTWLTERVSALQVQLEEAEQKLAAFSASTELVSLESLQGQEVQLKELRERITQAEESVIDAEERLSALQAAELRGKQAELADDQQLDRMVLRVESDDSIATAFDIRFKQVLDRAELEVVRLKQQVIALKASEVELSEQIRYLGDDLIKLQQLTREAEAIRLLYEYFLTRLNETAAQQGIQQADSRILSNAVVPLEPSAPKKSLILAVSGMMGLIISIGLVLLREARKTGYRTSKELEALTGYTVLGQIPQIPARNRKRILNYLAEKPTSAAAEAVRNLRTSVLMSYVDNPPQVIVSTSSVPGEGKTTNSLALAQNLVGMGKKVLLMEGDIRRRTFNQYFDNIPRKGLFSVVIGDVALEDAVFKPEKFGAEVLPGQKTSTNAADLFASEKFKALIADVRKKYDIIIVDTPPVLVVPDARIIAQCADAVLFTVLWDRTSHHQVEEALRMFHNSNQRVTGLVLSQINAKRMKSYGYGGRYGAYAGYGAKYYDS